MSKITVSTFTSIRNSLLLLGILACLTIFGGQVNAQGGRVIRSVSVATQPGQLVTVALELDSQANESSESFTVNYNAAVLTFVSANLGSGVPAGSNIGTNTQQTGQGRLGVLIDSTNTYAAGTRQIATIIFQVAQNAQLGLYPVSFGSSPTPQSVSSSAGALLPTTYVTGNVQIGSTAAGVQVSGRVLTPEGRGIRNATVTITDAAGVQHRASTSSFGFYRFDDVEAGASYVIAVASRQYRFTPRTVQIVDSLADFDFVGQQ